MSGTLPDKWILEVQEGGSGANNWAALAMYDNISQMIVSAPSGGGMQYTAHYGRNYAKAAQLEIVGVAESGQPAPYTFNLQFPLEARQARVLLQQLAGKKNLRARCYSGEAGVYTNYAKMLYYINARNTDRGYSRNLIDNTTNPGDVLQRTLGQWAVAEEEIDSVAHSKISGTVTTLAINKIISVGYPRPAGGGPGENTNLSGDEEFVFGTDRSGAGAPPSIGFTTDKGLTWTVRSLTGLNDVDIAGIVKAGANLVFCSNSVTAGAGGVRYVNYQNFKDNSYTVNTATGITTSTVISDIIAVSSSVLYACGAAGAVYKSTDGGLTWASAGTAVTANALTHAAYADENLVWFGGASGTVVRLYNGAMSLVTVTGLSTSAVTALEVPRGPFGRGNEVYVGSAAGNIHRSLDVLAQTTVWSTLSFDSAGSGSVDDIRFAGTDACIMYILQANGSSQSRILRDLSGGKAGPDAQILGGFTNPANSVINSIAPSSLNYVLAVGEVNGGQGYISQVA